jgi:large subunit ribosomal protein L10
MNKEQKAAAVAEIAGQLKESEAVFAVDYRGISVPQAAELRVRLREADATFRVVKNTLTERAAVQAGAETLKALLEGPTALTFVRGDAALAAKALQTFGRENDLLEFKGGLLGEEPLDPEQIRSIARLPGRDALFGQLVGVVASPVTGLVRGLNALIAGLALQLGQIAEKKESGEIPAASLPRPRLRRRRRPPRLGLPPPRPRPLPPTSRRPPLPRTTTRRTLRHRPENAEAKPRRNITWPPPPRSGSTSSRASRCSS